MGIFLVDQNVIVRGGKWAVGYPVFQSVESFHSLEAYGAGQLG